MAGEVALVPVQQRLIVWRDGQPVLAAEPVLTRGTLQNLYLVAAAQPYEVNDPLDPDFGKFDGMTIAEVLVRKQLMKAAKSGDAEAVMDRLIGKSLSRGENVNVNIDGSYEGFLKRKAAELAKVVDAEVVEPSAPGNDESFTDPHGEHDPVFGDLA